MQSLLTVAREFDIVLSIKSVNVPCTFGIISEDVEYKVNNCPLIWPGLVGDKPTFNVIEPIVVVTGTTYF